MRVFFLILLLAGAGLAGGYPWYIANQSGYELSRTPVYMRGGNWRSHTERLDPADGLVTAHLDMTSLDTPVDRGAETIVGVTIERNETTVLSRTVVWTATGGSPDAAQTDSQVYRGFIGSFRPAEAGDYTVTVVPGGDEGIPIRSVELSLRAQSETVDMRYVHSGIAILPIGVIGLVLSFRRKRPASLAPATGTDTPAAPEVPREPQRRWGRGDNP